MCVQRIRWSMNSSIWCSKNRYTMTVGDALVAKNFDWNTMLAFLNENLQITYIVVQETNGKIICKKKKKKTQLNFVQKMPQVIQLKNFDRNTMLEFFHKNLQITYIEVHVTNGKIFCKKKKKVDYVCIWIHTHVPTFAFLHFFFLEKRVSVLSIGSRALFTGPTNFFFHQNFQCLKIMLLQCFQFLAK